MFSLIPYRAFIFPASSLYIDIIYPSDIIHLFLVRMSKELKVTIRMNGRRSARIRKVTIPTKKPSIKMSPLKSILFWSPKKALLNISPKIDNKCPVSPAREPKQIEGLVKFHTMTNKPRACNSNSRHSASTQTSNITWEPQTRWICQLSCWVDWLWPLQC